jgi:hypothetical protein
MHCWALLIREPYIPLDPNFPKDRLEYIIENSKCETIIILGIFSC